MMAILHGKPGKTSRGDSGPPKSIAAKYADQGTGGSVESKGMEHRGGKWTEEHITRHKKRTIVERAQRKRNKKALQKALSEYVEKQAHRGAGCFVIDDEGRILLGMRSDNGLWSTPGGKVEPGETFEDGALRELKEEANIVGVSPEDLLTGTHAGWCTKQFVVRNWKGKPKTNGEFFHLHWLAPHEIPVDRLTDYTRDGLYALVGDQLKKNKSLTYMMLQEDLQKNIIRSGDAPAATVYELTHGDALRLIGNGTFRFLRDQTKDMSDEEIREIPIDTYVIHIRKHVNDVYSGWVTDGHKQVHQWTNRSLPALTAELMSLFEWYLPEDEPELELLDEGDLDDTVIEGGLSTLIDKYRKHNITNIYHEMENIRSEIRNGVAVDLREVEQRMMKLFDHLEEAVTTIADQHNVLVNDAGESIDYIENKLMELQAQIEALDSRPVKVDAYAPQSTNSEAIHNNYYPYLSKPTIQIAPSGHITIAFNADWTAIERENFLRDMKARVINKK